MKPVGFVRMNGADGDAPPDATIMVSGPPRGGTSFVAAVLHAANLWLGDFVDHTVFEDAEMSAALSTRRRVTRHLDWPLLRHLDSVALRRLVATRNATFAKWGFKHPNIAVPLAGRSGTALFRNPRLVMIFRDPVALAARIALAEGTELDTALKIARHHNDLNLATARYATVPVLLASYEKVVVQREVFFAELFDFCGLAVDSGAYPRIDAFADMAAKNYLKMAAAPIVGYINRVTDGVMYGWCRCAGRKGPETVDIYADDTLVATACADEFRPALAKAGIGRGRHGFSVGLDHLRLPDTCRLRVLVSGSGLELVNSGRCLGELRTPPAPPS